MPISLDQTQRSPDSSRLPVEKAGGYKWSVLLFWMAILLLIVAAVIMRLYHLNVSFDRDSYDEGVYWQSLRAMFAGGSLYNTIFYSQPPLFLLSTFPGFALFGGSLWSARLSIALVSLLAFPGAYLLGKSLAGRLGILTALLLLLVNPLYLAESQTIQAEASSVAFTFLALGFAFLWWKRPDGWRGACWAALAGITLVLSILCKLLCVSTVLPIGLLMFARIWQIWRRKPGTSMRSWLPILAGVGCALLTAVVVLLPFVGSFSDLWASVVSFHAASAVDVIGPHTTTGYNLGLIAPVLLSCLSLSALYGVFASFLRKDWRMLPLLAWLLVTLALLVRYHPLFPHHLIILEPPLIALAVLGVAEPASYKMVLSRINRQNFARFITILAVLLVLVTSFFSFQGDFNYYNAAAIKNGSATTQRGLQVANDLRYAITADEWVITDGQFIAGLADRSTPPSLVDVSDVRIETGYVTLTELEQAAMNPRVHAVLFYTNRFFLEVPAFHTWVAQHFHLLHDYGNGQELWVR